MVHAFDCVKGRDLCSSIERLQPEWIKLAKENKTPQTTFDGEKDRYSLPLVCEHSRVKLQPQGVYINANYVLNKNYIASQAPLPHTFSQFYDMIWQENVSVIVMLTKLEESQRCKAHRYWPTSCRPIKFFGDIDNNEHRWKVELLEKDAVDSDILLRTLCITLTKTGESRTITQVQYTGWPDHGCPSEIRSVAAVLDVVDTNYKGGPLLVHCSAGIGRTGTFIAIRHELLCAVQLFRKYSPYFMFESTFEKIKVLQTFLQEHRFSISRTVQQMRQDRNLMVQRLEQLKFCYEFFQYLANDENKDNYCMEEYILPFFFPECREQIISNNSGSLFSFP